MKTVLITGGSSGIGLEISKRFAANGYSIYWASLIEKEVLEAKEELLSVYPDTEIAFIIQDLSKNDGAKIVFEWIASLKVELDVLINNAGYATYGMSDDIPWEREENMIQLNVLNLYKLTRFFLQDMLSRNRGIIINISSSTSFQPVPRMAAYAATKAFVAHYSQALQEELKEQNSNVKVITVCPAGIKDTKFRIAAKMERVKTFDGLQATTKTEVADDIWKGFLKGQTYIKTGKRLRRTLWLTKVLPKSILLKMMKDELSEVER